MNLFSAGEFFLQYKAIFPAWVQSLISWFILDVLKKNTKYLFIVAGLTGVLLLGSFIQETEEFRYSQKATINVDFWGIPLDTLAFPDALSSDSLYLVRTTANLPLYYFRNIHTGVCFDNKCRELDIILYWNITGRYLGFELPTGEFLSKAEHKPFSAKEYERLNELLADPSLPFGGISFNTLIDASKSESGLVDGISGATSSEVEKIVVKGAAYTTYTLWNLVYGPTQHLVTRQTENQLTSGLVDLILKSPDLSDRVWALNRIDQSIILNPELSSTLLNIISGEEFFLAYSAINAIEPVHLDSDSFQTGLFSEYEEVNHSVKRMIVEKFMEAPYLSPDVVSSSRSLLEQLNGQQLGDFLRLYTKHSIDDQETCQVIAEILQNENSFISKKAYEFLLGVNTRDQEITEKLNTYTKNAPKN